MIQTQTTKKTTAEIQVDINLTFWLDKIDTLPDVIECHNEYGRMWRNDRGRAYTDIIDNIDYNYHLLFFDGKLGIVEDRGKTVFCHLTPELEARLLNGDRHKQWQIEDFDLEPQPGHKYPELQHLHQGLFTLTSDGSKSFSLDHLKILKERVTAFRQQQGS
jgi:hypothetical protein